MPPPPPDRINCQRPVIDTTPATRSTLPKGDAGTAATLAAMRIIAADAARKSPVIRGLAEGLLARAFGRVTYPETAEDAKAFAAALWDWGRANCEYLDDPAGVELVRHPDALLGPTLLGQKARGDCDDRATAFAAIIRAARIPAAFIVTGARRGRPFAHVLPAINLPDLVLPIDTQEADELGQLPAGSVRVDMLTVP